MGERASKTLETNSGLCYNCVNNVTGGWGMDFFERTNSHITELNDNERKIFEHVVRNIHAVKDMQIRALAGECYVSTTTIVRMTKKLGFSGYREFTDSIRAACQTLNKTEFPDVLWKREYSEEYLKNIIESVRVVSQEKIERFRVCLAPRPAVYFFGAGLDREPARYAYRLFTSMGYYTCCPAEDYEVTAALGRVKDGDLLFLFSLSGEDREAVRFVERARLGCKPVVATLTHSANNMLQSMSDIDFYVFTDQVRYRDMDLSSRISMFAVTELLAYSVLTKGM